jgi:peptide/nickel transport system permease protein
MQRYIVHRVLTLLFSLAVASLALFLLLRALPGDPTNSLISVGMDPVQVEAIQASLHINDSLLIQYFSWIRDALTFNFGESFVGYFPVADEIISRLNVTLPLTFLAFFFAAIIGSLFGFVAAYMRNTFIGTFFSGISQLGSAVPAFWVGILLIQSFAIKRPLFPSGGFPVEGWATPGEAIRSFTLPVLTIVVVMSASISRYVRTISLEIFDSEYVRTARSLGQPRLKAILVHGSRNALSTLMPIFAIELATTFIGAVVIESVFALPGLGSLLIKGIAQHDYPVIQSVLILTTTAVLIIGFIADVLTHMADPRLLKARR